MKEEEGALYRYFDGAVGRASDEPFVRSVKGDGPHPAQMT